MNEEKYRGKPLTKEMILEALRNPKPAYQEMIIIPPRGGFALDKLNKRADRLLERLK